jgi:hypothetical protein
MWSICGRILTTGIRARSKIWSYACPGEATASASGRATIGRCGNRVKTASTPSWEILRVIVVQWSNMEEATGHCRRQGGGRGWSLMGEVVPRCCAGSLIKIVVRKSFKSQVPASWHVESASSLWVVGVSKCLFLWGSVAVEACHVRGVAREQGSTCAKTRWWGGHLRVSARRSSSAYSGTMTG